MIQIIRLISFGGYANSKKVSDFSNKYTELFELIKNFQTMKYERAELPIKQEGQK